MDEGIWICPDSEFSERSVSSLFLHIGAVNFSEGCGCLLFLIIGYMIIIIILQYEMIYDIFKKSYIAFGCAGPDHAVFFRVCLGFLGNWVEEGGFWVLKFFLDGREKNTKTV